MMQPTYHEYRAPAEHNGAAILSLVCGVLWLLSITTMMLANSVSNAPGASGEALPEQVYTLLQCGFTLLPVVGIVAGGIGRLSRHTAATSAQIALAGACWPTARVSVARRHIPALELGPALVYWVQHL